MKTVSVALLLRKNKLFTKKCIFPLFVGEKHHYLDSSCGIFPPPSAGLGHRLLRGGLHVGVRHVGDDHRVDVRAEHRHRVEGRRAPLDAQESGTRARTLGM